MNMKKMAAVAATIVVATGTLAFAHTGATGIYKERMDAMMAMGKVIKELSAMMRGESEYDPEVVQEGARVIRSHTGGKMTELFPEGTTEKPSEARAEIWSDWETFSALAKQLAVYAEGLEKAAANGLAMSGGNAASMMGNSQSMMMGGDQKGMTGGHSGMMMGGTSSMMGNSPPMMTVGQLAKMPADGVFNMLARTCSSCHTKFRQEKK